MPAPRQRNLREEIQQIQDGRIPEDREPFKFGIAILGLYQNPDNAVLFQNLGRHEEFTLFAAVALARNSDDPEQALWSLGKNVNGWGRIHIVERLSDTKNPEIKNWLLRDGYKNRVMYEYLAYTCATAGGLLAALSEDAVDRELLTSSVELLAALINGGPAQDINDYEDGAMATELFPGHLESAAETLGDVIHVHAIRGYLAHEKADREERSQRGSTEERRAESLAACDRILNLPEWPVARKIGLPTRSPLRRRTLIWRRLLPARQLKWASAPAGNITSASITFFRNFASLPVMGAD